jgi:hypothetical protein
MMADTPDTEVSGAREVLANPSAFPLPGWNEDGPGGYPPDPGMTLRDWFAGQALAGMAAQELDGSAQYAYFLADLMLEARAKQKGDIPAASGDSQ